MKVTYFQRRPFRSQHSIEHLFDAVRARLPTWVEADVVVSRYLSQGVLGRLYNMVEAALKQGDVNHITGDVHFLALLLRRRRTVLTMHDAVFLQATTGFRRTVIKWLWYVLPAKRAARVTTISTFAKEELRGLLGADADRVLVIPDCVEEAFQPDPRPFHREKPRVLQVGTRPNKNLERVAAALEGLPCVLDIIGDLTSEQRDVLARHHIEYMQTAALSLLGVVDHYKACDLLLFVSTYEGFGMPIVEAQRVGRPVVTSNTCSMPEVAGDAACLVDPTDVASIRAGVRRVIEDDAYRAGLVERGRRNALRFTAESVARQYAALYEELLPTRRVQPSPARTGPASVLAFVDWYLPGFRGGGPARSISNLVEGLGDEFTFHVVTADRDANDRVPYPNLSPSQVGRVGKADVHYFRKPGPSDLVRLARATPHDVVYVNSFFSPRFSIQVLALRKLGLLPDRPVVLAPRGELSAGALAIKPLRKKLFLKLARLSGLYRDVTWQASTALEAAEVEQHFPGARIAIAADPPPAVTPAPPPREKRTGALRLAFLSRLSRKKNLDGALEMLRKSTGEITFDIYGPKEDPVYWRSCERLIERLPPQVKATYRGELKPAQVVPTLQGYDAFLLPTLGENFGHVLLEAGLAGCPIITSDRTPWSDLGPSGAGWTLPLDSHADFRRVIDDLVRMDAATHAALAARTYDWASRYVRLDAGLAANRTLFTQAAAADAG